MLTQLSKNYQKIKSSRIKLVALCIRAITGVLGASMILTQQRPYLTLLILCIGAVTNEIIMFVEKEEKQEDPPVPPVQ